MAFPIAAALVPAITSAAASTMSSIGSYIGGTKSAEISANAAEKNTRMQLAWEREKFNTAHQAEIADLEKAGLNPILSAGGSGATAGGINPQLPDTSGIRSAWEGLGNIGKNFIENYNSSQQVQNDIIRTMNETKETNSNLSLKSEQILKSMEERLNLKVERGLMSEKTKTEIMNRAKLKSDIELAQSQEFLNMQLKAYYEDEQRKIEQEIEMMKAELELHPSRKRAAEIQNDLNEKENKMFYIREAVNDLTRITSAGLSAYGTYQATQALSAYKSNALAERNKTMFVDMYNAKGKRLGQRVTYYKY